MDVKKTLDTTGLFCPLPIIKINTEIENLSSGEILEIIATDPGIKVDLPLWCKGTGNIFLQLKEDKDKIICYVRKK